MGKSVPRRGWWAGSMLVLLLSGCFEPNAPAAALRPEAALSACQADGNLTCIEAVCEETEGTDASAAACAHRGCVAIQGERDPRCIYWLCQSAEDRVPLAEIELDVLESPSGSMPLSISEDYVCWSARFAYERTGVNWNGASWTGGEDYVVLLGNDTYGRCSWNATNNTVPSPALGGGSCGGGGRLPGDYELLWRFRAGASVSVGITGWTY